MNTLCALDQRFLWHHYGWPSAADALDGEPSTSYGGGGPNRANFDSDSRGVHFTMPGEQPLKHRVNAKGWIVEYRHAHTITWKQLAHHANAQPTRTREDLHLAREEHHAEARRSWDELTAINKTWFGNATPEQRVALLAAEQHHWEIDGQLLGRMKTVVALMLPLRDVVEDEPADLIEWAEALS